MARRFVAPLTESEHQTLTSAYHDGEKRVLRRRAHALLLSDRGHTVNQISEILQVRRMLCHAGSNSGKRGALTELSTNLANASMHRSKAFMRKILEWMSHRVHLVYLSAYSPELNLIEILWRQMKYAWLPLSAYLSFDRLYDEVHRLLGGYGNKYMINYE